MRGGWFLECRGNFVHKEEKHLVQGPTANATGTAPMEIDDDDFSILPGAPPPPVAHPVAAAPVAQPKPRAKTNRRNAAADPNPVLEQASRRDLPNPNANAGGNEPDLTQASQGALGNRDSRAAVSAQVSTGGVTYNGSPPCSSTLDRNSAQSPLCLARSKHVSRPITAPKLGATSSSSPEISKLPMYLEKGNTVDLIRVSTSRKSLEPQLVDTVEHIKKVL